TTFRATIIDREMPLPPHLNSPWLFADGSWRGGAKRFAASCKLPRKPVALRASPSSASSSPICKLSTASSCPYILGCGGSLQAPLTVRMPLPSAPPPHLAPL